MAIESLPQITLRQLNASADVILGLEGNPFLSTPYDLEIFKLLKEYEAGTRKIHWVLTPEPIRGTLHMAHSCITGGFAAAPSQSSTEFVALTFYHELQHAVDCLKYVREQNILDRSRRQDWYYADEKGSEEVAYAAQVRFFLALHSKGMLPSQVSSATESNDGGIFEQTLRVWHAIHDNTFGEWYDRMVLAGPNSNTPPKFLNEVKPEVK